jgi:hypothetical protein
MTGPKRPVGLGRTVSACFLVLLATFACQPAKNPPHPDSVTATPEKSAPSRDLSRDESAGGHTLRKHVGLSDEQLSERLRHERNISAASTWSDRTIAEHAVGLALAQNGDKIAHWLGRPGGHTNLVLDYAGDPEHPIGRSLRRADDRAAPCARATIVLKWTGPSDYYVLTSYPECRE